MIEKDEVITENVEAAENKGAAADTTSDILQKAMWGETLPTTPQTIQEEKKEVAEEKKEEVKQDDATPSSEWWKGYGWDNEENAKAEIEKLKQVKPQEEIKFANEQSKQFYDYWKEGKLDEMHEMWSKNKQLEKLTSGEVTEQNAADILKASIKNKYKEFSDTDVERKFNKQYSIPKEPVIKEDELDDEFKARHDEWKERVDEIKSDILMDAKIAKPELEKLKAELVLPNINDSGAGQSKQLSQEELAAFEKDKTSFIESSEKMINDFSGFSAQVKDKDVDYSVSYSPSKEEKVAIAGKFKEFAESGFDANALFAQRWVNEDKTLNVGLMVKDYLRIFSDDKADQKLVNEAANQRLEIYLKDKKQININETKQNSQVPLNNKTESQRLQEQFWGVTN